MTAAKKKTRTRRTRATSTPKTRSKAIVKNPEASLRNSKLRKKPQYKSFRLHKQIKHPGPKLPSFWNVSKKALQLLVANKQPIAWFVIVYGLLSLLFVSGIVAPLDIGEIRERLETYTGSVSSFSNNVTILSLLLNSSFKASGEVSAMYQVIFIVTSSLALIWLFRQQQAGIKTGLKQAYYRGMYPLVPFCLVALVIGLQAVPAALGNFLYGSVINEGLAVTFAEQFIWFLFLMFTIILSLYLISTTIIALFIVTLPEMTPSVALKEAKDLVTHRRIDILQKMIALIIIIGAMYVATIFPTIFISALLAQVLYFLLTILVLPFIVAYLFVLYRELL